MIAMSEESAPMQPPMLTMMSVVQPSSLSARSVLPGAWKRKVLYTGLA